VLVSLSLFVLVTGVWFAVFVFVIVGLFVFVVVVVTSVDADAIEEVDTLVSIWFWVDTKYANPPPILRIARDV